MIQVVKPELIKYVVILLANHLKIFVFLSLNDEIFKKIQKPN